MAAGAQPDPGGPPRPAWISVGLQEGGVSGACSENELPEVGDIGPLFARKHDKVSI